MPTLFSVPRRDELIWMAGFFDGEGSIMMRKGGNSQGQKNRFGFRHLYPAVSVANIDKQAVLLFKKFFGGGIYPHRKKGKRSYRILWQWVGTGLAVHRLLSKIVPFLIVKKHRAILMLNLLKQRPKRGNWQHSSREFYVKQRAIAKELSFLNRRAA